MCSTDTNICLLPYPYPHPPTHPPTRSSSSPPSTPPVGDFGYADDRIKDYDQIWNQWQSQVEPLTSQKPYMVGPGNHEASCHSIGNVRVCCALLCVYVCVSGRPIASCLCLFRILYGTWVGDSDYF